MTKLTRELWLERGVRKLTQTFKAAGHTLPPVKVSCSWPGGRSAKKGVIGQCWTRAASDAGINEIFISPRVADPVAALDVLSHELSHAVDDCKHGHRIQFARIVYSIGHIGKPTNTTAGPVLRKKLEHMASKLGPYPHAVVDFTVDDKGPKKTYLVKVTCTDEKDCGAIFRMTTSWIDRAGHELSCPVCQSMARAG